MALRPTPALPVARDGDVPVNVSGRHPPPPSPARAMPGGVGSGSFPRQAGARSALPAEFTGTGLLRQVLPGWAGHVHKQKAGAMEMKSPRSTQTRRHPRT